MSRASSTFVVVSIAAVFLAFAAFFMLRDEQSRKQRVSGAEPLVVAQPPVEAQLSAHATVPTRIPQATSLARAAVPDDRRVLDEPALMATLRDLRGSNPELTLRLAREGNERFKRA
jgi:hypothetical protein